MKFRKLLILLLLCSCGSAANAIQSTPGPFSKVFLPIVERPKTYPIIYNCQGIETTEEWLHDYFGAVTWTQGISGTLTALWSRCGDQPASITVHVDRDGQPAQGVPVIFYWPDAPWLPDWKLVNCQETCPLCNCGFVRGIVGYTNDHGDVGFGMGGGSYYFVPDGGPHTIWTVSGPCVSGIGMLGGSNHSHLDLGISIP